MISKNRSPYLIAEVGSNHLGNFKIAKQSILLAKKNGADCVKFQLFDENTLVTKKMKIYKHVKDKKFKYQSERFKKVKLTIKQIKGLYDYAKKIKIDFSVTPFSENFVKAISKYVDFFKVASGDLDNHLLLKTIADTKKLTIISTGMSDFKEIKKAISFFNKKKIILLHCVSSYPTKIEDSNLINIKILSEKFKVVTGYSDHTVGIDAAANSTFFGAKVIEKHFLPENLKLAGDYKLSVLPRELKKLSEQIKKNFSSIGKQRNGVYDCERYYKRTLRRNIYYCRDLEKNHLLGTNDLIFLRPQKKNGIECKDYKLILGKRLKKKRCHHDLVRFEDLVN